VKLTTTKGAFTIEVHRDWSPNGADRFYNLVKTGYFTDVAFFRVIKGFMVQFGIHGDPAVSKAWRDANISDDPGGKQSNKRGMVTFATAGPNTRTSQIFINYKDNSNLDADGFAPFGQVVTGMEVVDKLYSGYGRANVPDQRRIVREGNAYLTAEYPKLDVVKSATIEK
jgi:peptidyl-prolyl cis-trans isomerase A (cyclophilin A)